MVAATPVEEDVISALVNLGYQRALVERSIGRLEKAPDESFDALFRKTLAALAK
jgi:Holliday junction resolvasome RuvABC DNA-binding subunit